MHAILLPASRITRLLNSYRHPDQAAIAARLPFAGRRVPIRAFWRRQDIEPRRMFEHATSQAALALSAGGRTATHAANGRIALVAGAVSIGAAAMYYLDPHSGRHRRALVRDRLAHIRRVITRDVPKAAERRGRFLHGVAKGVQHAAAEILPHRHAHADDETLVARVRSEVLRGAGVKAGEIHVDAYEGCVTLRGQLEQAGDIQHIVDATKRVEGVTEVRNYLHLPGELAPNKAAALGNGHAPAHMVR
jgi:hypothetical protein